MVSKRNKKINKILLTIVGLIVVVGLAAGAFFYYNKTTKPAGEAGTQKPLTTDEKIAQIIDSTADDNSNVEHAQSELKKLIGNEKDTTKQSSYLSASARIYINAGDYSNALIAAQKSEAVNPTALSAADVAMAYSQSEDYKNAAKYYDLAAKRSPKPASPTERAPYNDYIILKNAAEAEIK